MKLSIDVKMEIDLQDVRDLFIGAIEGGSNYWYMIESDNLKEITKAEKFISELPFYEGGYLMISDDAEGVGTGELTEPVKVDIEAIKKGVQVFATIEPKHFANFINDNSDATTSDVFFQAVVFGKIIYG